MRIILPRVQRYSPIAQCIINFILIIIIIKVITVYIPLFPTTHLCTLVCIAAVHRTVLAVTALVIRKIHNRTTLMLLKRSTQESACTIDMCRGSTSSRKNCHQFYRKCPSAVHLQPPLMFRRQLAHFLFTSCILIYILNRPSVKVIIITTNNNNNNNNSSNTNYKNSRCIIVKIVTIGTDLTVFL